MYLMLHIFYCDVRSQFFQRKDEGQMEALLLGSLRGAFVPPFLGKV